MKSKNNTLFASVIFYSSDGVDPTSVVITSANINQLKPDIQEVQIIKSYFISKGFDCQYIDGIAATIWGPTSKYEEVFKIGEFSPKNDEQAIPLGGLPEHIKNKIVSINFSEPVELFRSTEEEE